MTHYVILYMYNIIILFAISTVWDKGYNMVNVWPLSYGSVMELTSVCDGVNSILRNIDNREGLHLKNVTCKYNTCIVYIEVKIGTWQIKISVALLKSFNTLRNRGKHRNLEIYNFISDLDQNKLEQSVKKL